MKIVKEEKQIGEVTRKEQGREGHTKNGESLEKEYVKEFRSMLKDEITAETFCKIAQHRIETGEAKPVTKRNYTIPYHWEKEVKNEIQRNLANGAQGLCH